MMPGLSLDYIQKTSHRISKEHGFWDGEESVKDLSYIANPRFLELLEEERTTHIAKAAGYSGQDNPDTWDNFREATAWGLTPLQGCLVRLGDKYRRAQNLWRNPDNDRVGESFKNTLMDLSNYAKIAICLWEEEQELERRYPDGPAAAGSESEGWQDVPPPPLERD